MLEKIKKLRFYGYKEQEFYSSLGRLKKINKSMSLRISSLSSAVMLGLIITCYFLDILQPFKFAYMCTLISMVVILVAQTLVKKHYVFWLYCETFILYGFAAALAIAYPNERAAVSVIILPLLSIAIFDRIDRILVFNSIYVVAYCILVCSFKNSYVIPMDIFGMIISLIIGTVGAYIIHANSIKLTLTIIKNKELIEQLNFVQSELQIKLEMDHLSGLLNSATFSAKAKELLKKGEGYAVCVFDIDHFKNINLKYGSDQGDRIIGAIGETIMDVFPYPDVTSRFYGDEFVLYIRSENVMTDLEERLNVFIQRLRATHFGRLGKINCSIGVCQLKFDGENFQSVYQKARKALYYSKGQSNLNFAIYSDEIEEKLQQRLDFNNFTGYNI